MLKAKVPLSAQQTNKTESQHAHRLNFNRLLTRPHRPFCRWNSSMPGRTEPTTPKHTPSTRPSLSTGLNLTFQYQLSHLLKQRNLRRPMLHCGSLTLSCEPSSAAVSRSRGVVVTVVSVSWPSFWSATPGSLPSPLKLCREAKARTASQSEHQNIWKQYSPSEIFTVLLTDIILLLICLKKPQQQRS